MESSSSQVRDNTSHPRRFLVNLREDTDGVHRPSPPNLPNGGWSTSLTGVGAPHPCPLELVASYLCQCLYADVRIIDDSSHSFRYAVRYPMFLLPFPGMTFGIENKAMISICQTLGYGIMKLPAMKYATNSPLPLRFLLTRGR